MTGITTETVTNVVIAIAILAVQALKVGHNYNFNDDYYDKSFLKV